MHKEPRYLCVCVLSSVVLSHEKINSQHLQTPFFLSRAEWVLRQSLVSYFSFLQSSQRKQQTSAGKAEEIATLFLGGINQITRDPADNSNNDVAVPKLLSIYLVFREKIISKIWINLLMIHRESTECASSRFQSECFHDVWRQWSSTVPTSQHQSQLKFIRSHLWCVDQNISESKLKRNHIIIIIIKHSLGQQLFPTSCCSTSIIMWYKFMWSVVFHADIV